MVHQVFGVKAIADGSILTKTELPAISLLDSNAILKRKSAYTTAL